MNETTLKDIANKLKLPLKPLADIEKFGANLKINFICFCSPIGCLCLPLLPGMKNVLAMNIQKTENNVVFCFFCFKGTNNCIYCKSFNTTPPLP